FSRDWSSDVCSSDLVGTLVVFVLATGLLSGLFPALSLARYDPAVVIKGNMHAGAARRLARAGVTVVQFGFSTALVLLAVAITLRSEERRVGKECRAR